MTSEPLPASDLFGLVVSSDICPASPPRPNSPKQQAIVAAVTANGTITLAEATALVGCNVYANADKHTGALLGNMVKRGLLIRVKAGVFSLPNDGERRTSPTRQMTSEPLPASDLFEP